MQIITNVAGDESNADWSLPDQRVTILDTTNLKYLRSVQLTNDGVTVTAEDGSIAGIPLLEIARMASAIDPGLTWPPIITTQPTQNSVTNTAGVLSTGVSLVAVDECNRISAYQWLKSTDAGVTYINLSNAHVTGANTNTVAISNLSGMTGWTLACNVTNPSGTTTSDGVLLAF